MKFDYKKRFRYKLNLSKRQLDQISALHCVDMFITSHHLKDLPNINPEWLEHQRYKEFLVYYFEELQKNGFWDGRNIKIRKTKKGYVLEMKFNWRSKNIETSQLLCFRCVKKKKLNWHQFCEKCTKEVGGHKGIIKFWRNR